MCERECEELLKCVQRSRDSRLDFVGGSQLQAAKLKHMCQACQKLKRCASCSLQDKSSRLVRPFSRGLNSRLNLVARLSRQNTLFGKIWRFAFLLTLLYIYTLIPTIWRENFERETLEKTRLTHPHSLPKRLFEFLYSFPLQCQIHSCERAVWCFGKQLGRNQFHIGWCYGQVAEFGKLEKK